MQELHQALHDAQSQSIAFPGAVGRYADLIKLVVNEEQLIGRDAYAGVDDFEVHEGLFMQTA